MVHLLHLLPEVFLEPKMPEQCQTTPRSWPTSTQIGRNYSIKKATTNNRGSMRLLRTSFGIFRPAPGGLLDKNDNQSLSELSHVVNTTVLNLKLKSSVI